MVLRLLRITKIDDEQEVSPPPFSLLYFDVQTFSGKFTFDDPIRMIKVRYESGDSKENENMFHSKAMRKIPSFRISLIT